METVGEDYFVAAHKLQQNIVGEQYLEPYEVEARESHKAADNGRDELSFKKGDKLTVIKEDGAWLECNYEGNVGWVHRSYTKKLVQKVLLNKSNLEE